MNKDIRNSHVTPGVYTKEIDLTYLTSSTSYGTALGLVGETLKGPAFQPMLINDYATFQEVFGGTSAEVYSTQYPRYELPFIAKDYFKNGNNLYVSRILGLSGYDVSEENGYVLYSASDGSKVAPICVIRPHKDTTYTLTFDDDNSTLENLIFNIENDEDVVVITLEANLNPASDKFIKKVFGTRFESSSRVPFFIERYFTTPTQGEIMLTNIGEGATYGNFTSQFSSPKTPYIINENGEKLFKVISISDGDNANFLYKISIENIDKIYKTFNLVVRDYNDTDVNKSILEQFTGCSMDIDSINFIGNKIGTSDSMCKQISKYITIEVNHVDTTYSSVPDGFEGFINEGQILESNIALPDLTFRNTYNSTVKDKDIYFGINSFGPADGYARLLSYDADNITTTKRITPFNLKDIVITDIEDEKRLKAIRKFTVLFEGGFDGWDEFQTDRGFGGDTDTMKVYQKGIDTMNNPQAFDIDILATPGIDVVNNSTLVDYTINMVEEKRNGDCLYIYTTPDKAINASHAPANIYSAEEVVEFNSAIDSSYAATYFPWCRYMDNEIGRYICLPPTKNIISNMVYNDMYKYHWTAPAGLNYGIIANANKAKKALTIDEEDTLYRGRINPIRTIPKKDGSNTTLAWGQKTLQIKETMLTRINVRRLMIKMIKDVKNAVVKLLFEPNDGTVVTQFTDIVTPILKSIKDNRGIHDFRIQVDDSAEARARLALPASIFIKPIGALEYIELTFTLTPEGTNYDGEL